MNLDLSGSVAIVTGGSKGIGLAVARGLLAEGAHVVCASRTPPEAEVLHVPVDLMDPQAPATIVEATIDAFGGVDILVNNAGGPPPDVALPRFGFLGLSDDDWRRMLDFNLLSAVRMCREAIPAMLERGGGSIVNVSSVMARQPSAANVDYGAAKAALAHLTKSLAEEFGPQGLRVNAVTPGPVRTPWWTDAGGAADIFAAATGTDRDHVLGSGAADSMQLVTGRLVEPEEIADAVLLLASPRSGSTIGAEFVVDGGMLKAA